MDRWQELFTSIVDRTDSDQAMDPRWVEFYPYKIRVQPGEVHRFHLWITNHSPEQASCDVSFSSVDGVQIDPLESRMLAAPHGRDVCEICVSFPPAFRTHSLPVLADVTWKGERLGEIAEAIAYW